MNFVRKILGLGPKDPINTIPRKKTTTVQKTGENLNHLSDLDLILPVLVTKTTNEVELENQISSVFHSRENSFKRVLIALVSSNYKNLDTNKEAELFQVKPDEEETFLKLLVEHGENNIEQLDIAFEYWNPTDENFKFSIVSAPITFFSSELIMSKKHMLNAHEMLNSKELFVSIPRRGLIFICDKNLNKEDYMTFLNMHAYVLLKEDEEAELLCEDIFVVENGEITSVLEMHQLSDILKK